MASNTAMILQRVKNKRHNVTSQKNLMVNITIMRIQNFELYFLWDLSEG